MNERTWDRTTGFVGMMGVPSVAADPRKVRLFGVACCRLFPSDLLGKVAWDGLVAAESFADGALGDVDLHTRAIALHRPLAAAIRTQEKNPSRGRPKVCALQACSYVILLRNLTAARYAADRLVVASQVRDSVVPADARRLIPALLRDIFGNPFRPVAFAPAWRTSTAVALAQQMYEAREFSAMPILADAMQDAGCDNDDVLNHCRGDGVHVRGCWVVDLVLGKA